MLTKQPMLLLFVIGESIIINLIHYADCQSVFPTQAEQVNLLTNVHELFEQINSSARIEQKTMDKSMESDMDLMIRNFLFLIDSLKELMLLKLTSRSNKVCAIDAKEKIEYLTNASLEVLELCAKTGKDALSATSRNMTNVIKSAVQTGEEFLDKLNGCSEKRGLGVIACYKKIIQDDVLPAKHLISQAIENHKNGCEQTFQVKAVFNQCMEETYAQLRDRLDVALNEGLNCT